jgi:hypothetical protein
MIRSVLVRFRRFVLGPLLLVLGVGLITNTAIISGQVIVPALGEFQEEDIDCQEFHTWPNLPSALEDFGEYLQTDVASVGAEVLPGADDDDALVVSVHGAYPSYGVQCSVPYEVHAATGNLVELQGGVAFTPGNGLSGCAEIDVSGLGQGWGCNELTVLYFPPVSDSCISPGVFNDSLVFHVEQPALQQATMDFQLTLMWLECDPGVDETPAVRSNPVGGSTGPGTPAQLTSEVSPARDPVRAVARVSPATTGDGGLLGQVGDTPRTGLGTLLALAGVILVLVGAPTGVANAGRSLVERLGREANSPGKARPSPSTLRRGEDESD